MTETNKLTEYQKDILKEVANIGSGNAANALAGILGRRITISTGHLKIATIKNIEEVLGHKGEPAVGIYSMISGDIKGGGLIYMNQANTLLLADLLMNKPLGTTMILTDEDRSMLKEIGMILLIAYLDSLSKLSGLKILPQVPQLVYKRAEEIADFFMEDLETDIEAVSLICLQADFSQDEDRIPGEFLIFLDSDSFKKLLGSLEK